MPTENLLDKSNDEVPFDENKNYLEELVGEQKKFKTPEELAKAKQRSDMYIKELERGRDELRNDYLKQRDELMTRASMQEYIDQIKALQANQNVTPKNVDDQKKQPSIDNNQIESLISTKIQEIEDRRKQDDNFKLVKSKLTEKFGTNYASSLKQQMDSLGLNDNLVNTLAREHPQVLLRTLGVDQPQQEQDFMAPPRSSMRNDNFAPNTPKRTWSWYQQLKKDNPTKYWEAKTTVQMHKDYEALGSAFEDGDFHT